MYSQMSEANQNIMQQAKIEELQTQVNRLAEKYDNLYNEFIKLLFLSEKHVPYRELLPTINRVYSTIILPPNTS